MHLFLSPHFDDAVLSCGGTIHHLVQGGARVVVRTVMAGSPKEDEIRPDTPITRTLHARWKAGEDPVIERIREDEAAVTGLGAEAEYMATWMDCIYRVSRRGEPLYATQESIFGKVHPDDIAGQLLPTIVLSPDDVPRAIYAPLGAGNHVDHQIVRAWALELGRQYPWVTIRFYEDYPYTEKPERIEQALADFALLEPGLKLRTEIVRLDEADLAAKVKAVACYRSQINSFWQDEAAMETAVRAAVARTEGGERFRVVVSD